jgi:hypothetical protein
MPPAINWGAVNWAKKEQKEVWQKESTNETI